MNTGQRTSSEKFALTIFILPFFLFLLMTSLEGYANQEISLGFFSFTLPAYPILYTFKILTLTLVALLCLRPWCQAFPLHFTRKSLLAVLAGIVGVLLWVGVCKLELELKVMTALGWTESTAENAAAEKNADPNDVLMVEMTPEGGLQTVSVPVVGGDENAQKKGFRSGFNPFSYWGEDAMAWRFFIIRMLGLALLVPLLEEFFLRGFLLRFLEDQQQWMTLAVGACTPIIWGATAIYAAATHPGEMVAAILWFSMITWLVSSTKNIWDAVLAHSITNFLLGMYVLHSGDWYFL